MLHDTIKLTLCVRQTDRQSITHCGSLTSPTHTANIHHFNDTEELSSKLTAPQREVKSVANSQITSCTYPSLPLPPVGVRVRVCVLVCICICKGERPILHRIVPIFPPWRGCGPPWRVFKDRWWLWEMIPLCKRFLLFSLLPPLLQRT